MLYYQAPTLSKGRLMSFKLSLSLSRHLIVHKKNSEGDKFKVMPIHKVYDFCSLLSKPVAWSVNNTC